MTEIDYLLGFGGVFAVWTWFKCLGMIAAIIIAFNHSKAQTAK